ncbi:MULTISPECIES: hypothetical protein [unclassified Blastococcus]
MGQPDGDEQRGAVGDWADPSRTAPTTGRSRWRWRTAATTPEHIGLDHLPYVSTFIADWVADTFSELRSAGR